MKNFGLTFVAIGGLLLAACGADATLPPTAPTTPTTPVPHPGPPPVITSYHAGLQSSGGVSFVPSSDPKRRLELSAPITPRTSVIYPAEDAGYPASAAEAATLAHSAALTFNFLLAQCAADYPGVYIPASGDEVLTPAQLSSNYNAAAQCSYEKFSAKPYWIPQLVDDVDICATELGADWHLPTEAEVVALSAADITFLNSTLTDTAVLPGKNSWGAYYFSLTIFVRGTDGVLKLAELSNSAADRVTALGVAPSSYKHHLEHLGNPLALRCTRWTPGS